MSSAPPTAACRRDKPSRDVVAMPFRGYARDLVRALSTIAFVFLSASRDLTQISNPCYSYFFSHEDTCIFI